MAARATIVSVRAAARTLGEAAGAGRWIGRRSVAGHVAGNVRTLTTATPTTSTPAPTTPVDPFYAPDYPAHLPIPGSALAALCARLGLASSDAMHAQLVVALTDVSYDPAKLPASIQGGAAERAATGDNTLLAALGNSLLGLYASEQLATVYPNLPTRALKALVSLHVGPAACFDVARSLGLGVANAPFGEDGSVRGGAGFAGKHRKRSTAGAGVSVRWVRGEREAAQAEGKRRTTWEEVVARSVRALVALVYQEKGIAAARKFVHAHFMSRHVDVASVLSFRHPKHVLGVEVRKLLGQAGAPELAGVQSRILAESGRHSLSPIYNIGLFLPSGLKLAEGYGSSLRMAEHRAARNALVSIYTARGELLVRDHPTRHGERVGMQLPTEVYPPPSGLAAPAEADSVTRPEAAEREFAGSALLARAEALMASGERARGTRR